MKNSAKRDKWQYWHTWKTAREARRIYEISWHKKARTATRWRKFGTWKKGATFHYLFEPRRPLRTARKQRSVNLKGLRPV